MIFEHDETSQLPTRCWADPDTGNLRLAPRLSPARSLSMIHPLRLPSTQGLKMTDLPEAAVIDKQSQRTIITI